MSAQYTIDDQLYAAIEEAGKDNTPIGRLAHKFGRHAVEAYMIRKYGPQMRGIASCIGPRRSRQPKR